jgi:XapX domain-containing protein
VTDKHESVVHKNEKRVMKDLLISFSDGAFVGLRYGFIKVKSPAPPIIALLGLFGMVVGEQVGGWIHTRKVNVAHAASTCLVGKHWDPHNQAAERPSAPHRAE